MSISFQMIEEVENKFGSKLLDFDPERSEVELVSNEADQQLEAICVTLDRMFAGALVTRQMFREEPTDVRSEFGHRDGPLVSAFSAVSAICRSKVGVASRYQ